MPFSVFLRSNCYQLEWKWKSFCLALFFLALFRRNEAKRPKNKIKINLPSSRYFLASWCWYLLVLGALGRSSSSFSCLSLALILRLPPRFKNNADAKRISHNLTILQYVCTSLESTRLDSKQQHKRRDTQHSAQHNTTQHEVLIDHHQHRSRSPEHHREGCSRYAGMRLQ